MQSCRSLKNHLPLLWLGLSVSAHGLSIHSPSDRGPHEHQHWLETRQIQLQPSDVSQTQQSPLVIDTFQSAVHNDLGFWHGTGEDLAIEHEPGVMRLFPSDPDQNFHTQLDSHACFSLSPWSNQFLHVVFDGNEDFTVSLNEHNAECNPARSPFPGTADSVQASRYLLKQKTPPEDDDDDDDEGENMKQSPQATRATQSQHGSSSRVRGGECQSRGSARKDTAELFIPLNHFRVNLDRLISVSFSGFFTEEPIALHRVEIVPSVPAPAEENGHFALPEKLPTGSLVLRCSRPNSFAFGIDDGQPQFAQEVMRILDEENVRATFFVVASGLRDESTNFTNFYREMLSKGHQVALHSNTHPKIEALPSMEEIDDEIIQSIDALREELQISSKYFRPPFGTVGARLRQRLAKYIENPYVMNWSVDVEDWLWANSPTPEHQLDAFYRGVARGGNLAVMHYLHPTTVAYLRPFIHYVKSKGLKVMRVDQCLEDPSSPPL
ncbi:putative peptidoglycan N-acetylglucosamine deacetylase [Penicillium oxalicum 114-2]|uniref:Putative peptidoglycan N-acetylglucosamine deacetylase n=1 Tax=Penicillium oxalicum (strain 114-2 / CGMCC 5302) TaxID=933388 RepID=S7ZDV2_PENO1|nr:putative peptidoglycan N-acetylglucosamine deacetylase [Penicillium oxalicum 114-2]